MRTSDLKIKICGLSREADIDFVNAGMPDYVGFVFAKSKREVSFEKAANLKKNLSPEIKTVGVFVNEPAENIVKLYKTRTIDLAQLHGDEDEIFIEKLKSLTDMKVIKAVKAVSANYIQEQSKTLADYVLIDSFKGRNFGGTGMAFDWTIVPEIDKPFFLAGGINSDNLKEVIKMSKPFCLDVSSGAETEGVKDKKKIIEIINLIRGLKYERL